MSKNILQRNWILKLYNSQKLIQCTNQFQLTLEGNISESQIRHDVNCYQQWWQWIPYKLSKMDIWTSTLTHRVLFLMSLKFKILHDIIGGVVLEYSSTLLLARQVHNEKHRLLSTGLCKKLQMHFTKFLKAVSLKKKRNQVAFRTICVLCSC